MRYRFFLSYMPMMLLVSVALILLADRYDGKAVMVGYQNEANNLDSYNGELLGTDKAEDKSILVKENYYNGENIKDNAMPYCIKVNKKENVVTVYKLGEDGYYSIPVKAMICSVGKKGNTPEGIYHLGGREKWLALEDGVYGQYATTIIGDILFHSVPYYTQNKADLEVEEYNMLGSSVSAGCVRISVIDAKWIYDNCGENTIVNIFESDYAGPMGKPVSAVIDSERAEENWDPTDPDRDNPYMKKEPVILGAYDREIERFSDFDVRAGVTALDSTGQDITDRMEVEGKVDSKTCGRYDVTYRIMDETEKTTSVKATFTIMDNQEPVLYVNQVVDTVSAKDAASSKHLHDLLLQNVCAYDSGQKMEDDSIIVDYSEILEKKCGKCHVKYRAKDSEGNQSELAVLSVDVDIEAPTLTLKNGMEKEIRVSNLLNDNYLLSLVKADDNSGKVDVTVSRPLTYTTGEPYNVIYCAKDDFGNVATFSVTYQIKE